MSKEIRPQAYSAPPVRKLLAEFTALLEVPMFMAVRKTLAASLPVGDGHPVMVLPGFMASDAMTTSLRKFLQQLGYQALPWELGTNPGLCQDTRESVLKRINALSYKTNRKISLIGWSAGGIYARLAAHDAPQLLRQIVCLGSPFGIDYTRQVDSPVGRLHQRTRRDLNEEPLIESGLMHKTPPVPSTSIVSRRDGISHWKYSLDIVGEYTENIIVPGSHSALCHNPFVGLVVADRLAQPENGWQHFKVPERCRHFMSTTCASQAVPAWIRDG